MKSPTNLKNQRSGQSGFTLVELSIVLVIIGLIVGGVLVGQEMIRAAETRAVITQLERYNTAVNLFRGKYVQLPGDLRNPNRFFTANGGAILVTPDPAIVANGNGLIEDDDNTGAAAPLGYDNWSDDGGEIIHFWYQLALAGMVENLYTAPTAFALGESIPTTRLGQCHLSAFGATGRNYFQLANFTGGAVADCLNPTDAYNLDQKLDDGNPSRGTVIALDDSVAELNNAATPAAGGATATDCSDDGVDNTAGTPDDFYNATSQETVCQLRFQMN